MPADAHPSWRRTARRNRRPNAAPAPESRPPERREEADMADIERILIVGGGIAGLSVATALHRRGLTPELVERSTTWPAVGAGIIE